MTYCHLTERQHKIRGVRDIRPFASPFFCLLKNSAHEVYYACSQNNPDVLGDSPAWTSFIWIGFVVSITLMLIGIYYLPVDW